MILNRRFFRRNFLAALSVPVAVSLGRGAGAAETYTMRLNITQPATAVQGRAATHFASAVAHRSNGQVKVEVYPNSQLGSQAEMIDALRSGVVDFTIESSSFLVPLTPRVQVFDVPFLFRNPAAGYRVIDGPVGEELLAELEPKGIVGLGWGSNGFRQISTSTKAVTVPEDLRGVRMRIQNEAVQIAMYQAFGAIPVPVDAAEVFTALAQHTVEGMDNNIDVVTQGKYYTIIKHVAMSNHVFSVSPLLVSKRKFDALPAALQKIIKEEGKGAILFSRDLFDRQIADDVKILKDNGVAFTEIQFAPFRKAAEPVYGMVQAKIGGNLIERIRRVAGL
jgi:TRAP-type transport system periplasmic protein